MKTTIPIALLLLTAAALHAGPRSSTSYNVLTDTNDAGGKRATSASYTNDGSLGGVTGLSSVAAPAQNAKSGYIGQLYDVSGLQLAASPTTLNEGGTRQLSAAQLLDDSTTLAVPAASVIWSVVSGPLNSVSAGGLATAATVFQNTGAIAEGSYLGNTGVIVLNVLDSIPDNFGSYAADQVGDDWQVQYFGQDNPNAAPGFISDGSGLTNLTKFVAGLTPGDANSRLVLNIAPVPGQPTQMSLIFSPIVSGRTYTLTSKTNLSSGTWTTVPGVTFSDTGAQRTLTDPSVVGPRKFYRMEISRP